MSETPSTPPGWYPAPGDPEGTNRYWDGEMWQGGPQPIGGGAGGYSPAGSAEGMTPHGARLASAGQRIGARLIDAVIVFVLIFLVIAAIVGGGATDISFGLLIIGILFSLAYEVATTALLGGTPGKLMLGLKVTTADTGLTPVGWEPAIKRWLPSLAGNVPVIGPILSLGIAIVSLVWLFNDPKRQTVWDKVGNTYVIQTK